MKNGRESLSDGTVLQRYRCQGCDKCFNDRTGTPMARLRTPSSVVATALKGRSEGLGPAVTLEGDEVYTRVGENHPLR